METTSNWFVRTLIVLLCGLIVFLVISSFLWSTPKGQLSSEIILLLILLITLTLSESFDNFSIGKLFSLSREKKKAENFASELKAENSDLRNQLITVATSVNQNQSTNNIFGLTDEALKNLFKVQEASKEEVEEKETAESPPLKASPEISTRRIDHRKIEEFGLERFINDRDLGNYKLIQNAKLTSLLHGTDPISDIQPIFDAYIKTEDAEIFIEIRPKNRWNPMHRDRLYLMLNKIHHYKSVKNVKAYLAYIMVDLPVESEAPSFRQLTPEKEFDPAITNNLLRIYEYSSENGEEEFYRDTAS